MSAVFGDTEPGDLARGPRPARPRSAARRRAAKPDRLSTATRRKPAGRPAARLRRDHGVITDFGIAASGCGRVAVRTGRRNRAPGIGEPMKCASHFLGLGDAALVSDESLTPAQRRNRRLFGALGGWLIFDERRPGMVGSAVSFSGQGRSGRAEVERIPTGWRLREGQEQRQLTTAEVLQLVGSGEFFPRTVNVVPDLAALLFTEAVHQAEISVGRLLSAREHIATFAERDVAKNPIPWVLATGELDRSVRASIASMVLAVAAAEAQVNLWAESLGGWRDREDRLPVTRKCQVLAVRVGQPVSLGEGPYQQLHQGAKRRNRFVHSRPVPEPVAVLGAKAVMPGSSISVEARSLCFAVRSSFIDLARRLGTPAPSYLAYCPPANPHDEAAWSSASIMTGTRSDPDFPTLLPTSSTFKEPDAGP